MIVIINIVIIIIIYDYRFWEAPRKTPITLEAY